MPFIETLTGIALLLAGGTALVRGASALATRAGISPLVVGLTIVAFGTSTPELMVNVMGALMGQTELAFGNVVGSNIANVGLVLGAAALIAPVAIDGSVVRREIPLVLLITAMLLVMCLDPILRAQPAVLDRSDGVLLFLMFSIFLYLVTRDFLEAEDDPLVQEVRALHLAERVERYGKDALWIAGGIALLAIGGHLTISGGSALAEQLGVSPAVVGIVVVAVGTSMPELVTSIIAAARREAALCVGNVVGSNLFNAAVVMPASAVILPVQVPQGGLLDIAASFVLLLALVPVFLMGNARMGRPAGAAMLTLYIGYVAYRATI